MKKLIASLLLCSGTFLAHAQNRILVDITNFDSDKGILLAGLYNTEDSFLKKEFLGQQASIKNKKVSLDFSDIPDGTYAISVFHDKDENGELTTNFLGIPKEAHGSSNNAPARFGPPKWKDASFEVKNGQTVRQHIAL